MVTPDTSIGYDTGIWNTEEDLRIFHSSKNHIAGMDLDGKSKLVIDSYRR